MKRIFFSITMLVVIFSTDHFAQAHGGGLEMTGCHGGTLPYHCHRNPDEMRKTKEDRNRIRCDLGSRSVECIGRYDFDIEQDESENDWWQN